MGADYISIMFATPTDVSPNLDVTVTPAHIAAYKEYRYGIISGSDVEFEDVSPSDDKIKEELEAIIEEFKDVFEHGSRDSGFNTIGEYGIIHTGGMSWGDSPTLFFDVMAALYYSGIAESMGFIV